MIYRRVPKVYKNGNVYWHIERYKNDRWITVIPYLGLEESIYLIQDPRRIDYFIKMTVIAEVGVWVLSAAVLAVIVFAII